MDTPQTDPTALAAHLREIDSATAALSDASASLRYSLDTGQTDGSVERALAASARLARLKRDLSGFRFPLPSGDLARIRPQSEEADESFFWIERLDARGRVSAAVSFWTDGATLADALEQAREEIHRDALTFDSADEERLAVEAVPILSAYFSALQPPTA